MYVQWNVGYKMQIDRGRYGKWMMIIIWWNFEKCLHFQIVPDDRTVNSNLNNEQLDRMDAPLKKNSSHWSIDFLCNLFLWTNVSRITHGKKVRMLFLRTIACSGPWRSFVNSIRSLTMFNEIIVSKPNCLKLFPTLNNNKQHFLRVSFYLFTFLFLGLISFV